MNARTESGCRTSLIDYNSIAKDFVASDRREVIIHWEFGEMTFSFTGQKYAPVNIIIHVSFKGCRNRSIAETCASEPDIPTGRDRFVIQCTGNSHIRLDVMTALESKS